MQKVYADIQAVGAEVIAISSDIPEQTKRAIKSVKDRFGVEVRFPVLSDAEGQTINAYNAEDPFNPRIARPQYHIIDENGVVRWKFVDVRLGGRINPAQVVEELKKL